MKLKTILLTSITALTVMVRGTNAVACWVPKGPPNPCNCSGGGHSDAGDDRGDHGDHGDYKPPKVDHGDHGDSKGKDYGDHGKSRW